MVAYGDLFAALTDAAVPYVVVGGTAVVLQGHARMSDELAAEATTVRLDGVDVPGASVAHLIAMKTAVGRPQDLQDVAALQRIEGQP